MKTLVLTEMEFEYLKYVFIAQYDGMMSDCSKSRLEASYGIADKVKAIVTPVPKAKADVWGALHEIARSY